MKATIEYNLPDDQFEFDNAVKSNKMWHALTEIKDELLNEVKLTMEEIVNNDNEEDSDANIFKLLKKVPTFKSETTVKNETTNDNKIAILQNEVKTLNNKLDLILELLKNKN